MILASGSGNFVTLAANFFTLDNFVHFLNMANHH